MVGGEPAPTTKLAPICCMASLTSLLIVAVICGSSTDQDADSIYVNAELGTVLVELDPGLPVLDDMGTDADLSVFAIILAQTANCTAWLLQLARC